MLLEDLKEQHSDAETSEPKPPKKKTNLLLVASDSADENEHAPSEYETSPEQVFYCIAHLTRRQQDVLWVVAVTSAGRSNISAKVIGKELAVAGTSRCTGYSICPWAWSRFCGIDKGGESQPRVQQGGVCTGGIGRLCVPGSSGQTDVPFFPAQTISFGGTVTIPWIRT
ncbi:hypothetical protein KIL84_015777 [Mauremys mutica]|uniref:Uncharacterized protein n=1 Tax=Mauremys mutica TaxID=74926 RepID=A0A9D4ASB7_9SAUR|nr:hypothetical protein KIL84_015777 [Mauremys mutica]